MAMRLLVPPGMEDVYITGIKREKLPGGVDRLYLYMERPKDPKLDEELEDSPKRLEVLMCAICRTAVVEATLSSTTEKAPELETEFAIDAELKLN